MIQFQIKSLAVVMRAIGTREDVAHGELVLMRRRALYVFRLARERKVDVSPALVAFALLSYLENGKTPKQVRKLSATKVIKRAQTIVTPSPGPLPAGKEGELAGVSFETPETSPRKQRGAGV